VFILLLKMMLITLIWVWCLSREDKNCIKT